MAECATDKEVIPKYFLRGMHVPNVSSAGLLGQDSGISYPSANDQEHPYSQAAAAQSTTSG